MAEGGSIIIADLAFTVSAIDKSAAQIQQIVQGAQQKLNAANVTVGGGGGAVGGGVGGNASQFGSSSVASAGSYVQGWVDAGGATGNRPRSAAGTGGPGIMMVAAPLGTGPAIPGGGGGVWASPWGGGADIGLSSQNLLLGGQMAGGAGGRGPGVGRLPSMGAGRGFNPFTTQVFPMGLAMSLMFGGWEAMTAGGAYRKAERYARSHPGDLAGQLNAWETATQRIASGPLGSWVGAFNQAGMDRLAEATGGARISMERGEFIAGQEQALIKAKRAVWEAGAFTDRDRMMRGAQNAYEEAIESARKSLADRAQLDVAEVGANRVALMAKREERISAAIKAAGYTTRPTMEFIRATGEFRVGQEQVANLSRAEAERRIISEEDTAVSAYAKQLAGLREGKFGEMKSTAISGYNVALAQAGNMQFKSFLEKGIRSFEEISAAFRDARRTTGLASAVLARSPEMAIAADVQSAKDAIASNRFLNNNVTRFLGIPQFLYGAVDLAGKAAMQPVEDRRKLLDIGLETDVKVSGYRARGMYGAAGVAEIVGGYKRSLESLIRSEDFTEGRKQQLKDVARNMLEEMQYRMSYMGGMAGVGTPQGVNFVRPATGGDDVLTYLRDIRQGIIDLNN